MALCQKGRRCPSLNDWMWIGNMDHGAPGYYPIFSAIGTRSRVGGSPAQCNAPLVQSGVKGQYRKLNGRAGSAVSPARYFPICPLFVHLAARLGSSRIDGRDFGGLILRAAISVIIAQIECDDAARFLAGYQSRGIHNQREAQHQRQSQFMSRTPECGGVCASVGAKLAAELWPVAGQPFRHF